MSSNIERVLTSKLTAKKKAKAIGSELLEGALKPSDLIEMSRGLADAELAIVIESLEGASRKQPELVDDAVFAFLVKCLARAAPRVKWESARTIGNVAGLHAKHLAPAADALLANASSDGTVVRWATARALTAIVRAGHSEKELRARLSKLAAKETDQGVRAVYEKGLRAWR